MKRKNDVEMSGLKATLMMILDLLERGETERVIKLLKKILSE